MTEFFYKLLNLRWFALIIKEFNQIKRNRRLVILLIIPPTLNIVLFGFALNPTVTNLQLGVVDESRSAQSRELIAVLTESRSFQVARYYSSTGELGDDLSSGGLDAGLVIPANFDKKRLRGETADIQLIVDAVNSNTATIAVSYATNIISVLNKKILRENPSTAASQPIQAQTTTSEMAQSLQTPAQQSPPKQPNVTPRIALFYNPGLQNSWFIVAGLIGALLVLQGSVVASASMVREKEVGTIEQLLMTPAGAVEIITAKMAPIFLLLSGDIFLSLVVSRIVFGVPVRGSLLLFFVSGSLCVLSGIGIGTLIATFVKSQQQAQLLSTFVNPPLILLSGATTPLESMPKFFQAAAMLNPVSHFAIISRSILLKGSEMNVLYPNLLALLAFCVVVMSISMWRFRKQLQ